MNNRLGFDLKTCKITSLAFHSALNKWKNSAITNMFMILLQSFAVPLVCSTFKDQQMYQKMKKSLVQLAFFKPIFPWRFENPKSRAPNLSLIATSKKYVEPSPLRRTSLWILEHYAFGIFTMQDDITSCLRDYKKGFFFTQKKKGSPAFKKHSGIFLNPKICNLFSWLFY